MEIYLVNLSHSMIWFHLNLCVDHNPDIWMDDILYALHRFRIFNILCKLHFIGHRNISQLMFSGILSKKKPKMSLCEFSKWRNLYSNVEWSFLDPQGCDTVGPLQRHLITWFLSFDIWHMSVTPLWSQHWKSQIKQWKGKYKYLEQKYCREF